MALRTYVNDDARWRRRRVRFAHLVAFPVVAVGDDVHPSDCPRWMVIDRDQGIPYALVAATEFGLADLEISGYLIVVIGVKSLERVSEALLEVSHRGVPSAIDPVPAR